MQPIKRRDAWVHFGFGAVILLLAKGMISPIIANAENVTSPEQGNHLGSNLSHLAPVPVEMSGDHPTQDAADTAPLSTTAEHGALKAIDQAEVPVITQSSPFMAQSSGNRNAIQSPQGWYVAVGSTLIFDEAKSGVFITPPLSVGTDLRFAPGFSISGMGGYAFEDFRLEGEVMYSRQILTSTGNIQIPGGTRGGLHNVSILVNGYYDIPTQGSIKPYVGGGAGIAFLSSYMAIDNVGISGGETVFVYQLKAGVTYELDDLDLYLGYRFLGLSGSTYSLSGSGLPANSELRLRYSDNHSLELGARYRF